MRAQHTHRDPPRSPDRGRTVGPASPSASRLTSRRHRWQLVVAAMLAIVVVSSGISIWLRHLQTPQIDQGPFPTVMTFVHAPIACPAAAAWSPDSSRVAVMGFSACPQNAVYPASGPAIGATLTVYTTSNGRVLQTIDLGHAIATQALPPSVRNDPAAVKQAQLLFGATVWSAHTHQLAVDIATFYVDPNGSGQPNTYDVALVLIPDGGSPRVFPVPGSQSNSPFSVPPSTSFVGLPATRWDLSTGIANEISEPQGLAYTWANDTLSALQPFPATPGSPPPDVGVAAVGDPGGDPSFSIWQQGSIGFGVTCSGPNGSATCCTDTTHLTASLGSTLAWSPDGRYVVVPQFGSLAAGAIGQFPAPLVNAANIPGACVDNPAIGQFATLPVRDAGLANGLRAFDLTRVGLVVAWSPDGQRIAVRADHSLSGSAHELSIFDCRSGKLLGSYSAQQVQHGLPPGRGSTTQVSIGLPPIWSPDGTHLLVVDNDLRVISILGPNMLGS